MKNLGKIAKAVIGGVCCVSLLSITAFAGTTMTSFSTTVGKINGNGYTTYQTKTTTGASPHLKCTNTGGYNVDVRCNSSSASGSWYRNAKKGTDAYLTCTNNHTSGTSERLQFSNDLTTLVDTQCEGTWASN